MTAIEWLPKANGLAEELAEAGILQPGWRPAFANVPRHVFVPLFYRDDGVLVDGSSPEQRDEWLAAVYRDDSLITQQIEVPGTDMMWPTSSSTRPSLMARMLGLLDVADGHIIMEIGTGTGYNAALMCHRLGHGNVASIDIHPTLVEEAGRRLGQVGYQPLLVTGDGADGIPDRAPYDRIIATCAVPAIPASWVTQLRHRGVIVADLRGELSSALVTLTKTSDDVAQGRFLSVPGHFMWLRAKPGNPLRDGGSLSTVIDTDKARKSVAILGPSILNDPEFRFILTLTVPGIVFSGHLDRAHSRVHILRSDDGSWAEIDATGDDERYPTTHGGPRTLWDEVATAATWWVDLGRPDRCRFGVTVTGTGNQDIWLDDPNNVVRAA